MQSNADPLHDSQSLPAGIQGLWSAFRDSGGEDYFRYWLAIQASLIDCSVQGLLVLGNPDGSGGYLPVATWARGAGDPARLTGICESALDQRCGLLAELPPPAPALQRRLPSAQSYFAVAYPVLADDLLYGVVSLEVTVDSEDRLAPVMEQLQWGTSWLELHYRRLRAREDSASLRQMKPAFDLVAGVLAEQQLAGANRVFVTELATLMKCDRVSLGLVRRGHIVQQRIQSSARLVDLQSCRGLFPPRPMVRH